jgi:hypothetical protein
MLALSPLESLQHYHQVQEQGKRLFHHEDGMATGMQEMMTQCRLEFVLELEVMLLEGVVPVVVVVLERLLWRVFVSLDCRILGSHC